MIKKLYLKLLINIYDWTFEINTLSGEAIAKALHVDISNSDSLVKGINRLSKIKHKNLLEIKWTMIARRAKAKHWSQH